MNKLSSEKREQILHLLFEGNSLRATSRLAEVAYNSVAKLFIDAAKACLDYQDGTLRNLKCRRVQIDEIWSFVYAEQKSLSRAKAASVDADDVWTWVAIDAETKLVPSWRIGDRSSETAIAFTDDLAKRLASHVQLTTDSHKAYLEAIDGAFGGDIDYGMLIRVYGPTPEGQRRYSPADAFSKKIENHAHSVALHYMHYNFCRIHKTLRVTPAMAAGVIDRLWSIADMVAVLEAWEAEQNSK